jgi:hypothetical protein
MRVEERSLTMRFWRIALATATAHSSHDVMECASVLRGKQMRRVSIVIPTYNRADLLPATLDSVLAQTYRDLEVLVVDNASTDETPALMDGYIERDPRVRYIRKPVNKGMVDSYNLGYRLSQGEYFHYFDSDDLLLPEAVAMKVEQLDRHQDVDVVYTRFYYMDASGRKLYLSECAPHGDEETLRLMLKYPFVHVNTALLRRRVMGLTPDGPYDPLVPNGAGDWHLLLNLLLNGARFLGIDEPTMLYRMHPGNHTRKVAGYENDMKTHHAWIQSDPRLPAHLKPVLNESLAFRYLWFCGGYYFQKDYENGKRALEVTWNLMPEWHTAPDLLIKHLAIMACSPYMLEPMLFVDALQAHPPESIGFLKQPAVLSHLRARVYVNMALRALDAGDVASYQRMILSAYEEDPGLKKGAYDVAGAIAEYAQHSISNDPEGFVTQAAGALPAAVCQRLSPHALLGAFYMVDAFAQYNRGNARQVVADVTASLMHTPHYMRNRGLLSIFRKSLGSLAQHSLHKTA